MKNLVLQALLVNMLFVFQASGQISVQINSPISAPINSQTLFTVSFYDNSYQVTPPSGGSSYWEYADGTLISESDFELRVNYTSPGQKMIYYEYSTFSDYYFDYYNLNVEGYTCSNLTPSSEGASREGVGSVTLIANTAPAGFSYVWYDSNQTTLLSSSQNFVTSSLTTTKTYYLGYKQNSTNCLTQLVPVNARIIIYNSIKKYSARIQSVSKDDLILGGAAASFKSFSFFDALGRSNQTVLKNFTITGKDLITPSEYDQFGRQVKEYLPYFESTGSQDGRFRSNALTTHPSRTSSIYGDSYGFVEKKFEPSPINRVDKILGPGSSWALTPGKEFEFFRRPSKTDEARLFYINSSGLPVTSAFYPINSLWVEITNDEDDKLKIQYFDKLGHMVLEKVQNTAAPTSLEHAGWLCTYYVYDDLGYLKVVIPPKAVEVLNTAGWTSGSTTSPSIADELYFRYAYDGKGRMIEKRVPGKGVEYLLYDSQDRLVGFQDSNLRAGNRWVYTKYDGLGRVLLTGLTTNATDFYVLQSSFSGNNNANLNSNTANVKTGSTITSPKYDGYKEYVATSSITLQPGFIMKATGTQSFVARIGSASSGAAGAWPTDEGEILTVNYYDTYQFLTGFPYLAPLTPYSGFTAAASLRTHGLQTGKKVKNLETGEFYTSAIYYDDKGRIIQTIAQQQLGGTVRTSSSYNFEDQPTQTLIVNSSSPSQSILRTYTYNVTGLLATITHKIGSHSAKTIVQNTYNDLGQLTTKAFPQLPSGNQTYTYNIRGWLKTLGSGLTEGYKQTNYYETGGSVNNWNGNISRIDWSGKSVTTETPKVRTYNYSYDKVNRITAATYTAASETNWYTVSGMNYDANGNILAMTRRNQRTATTYDVVDQLSYSYIGNGNKLMQVADANNAQTYTSKGFIERSAASYTYDANGNLKTNLDKQINNITYNHLNLPSEVAFNTGAKISFTYDAEGVKLSQKVYNNSGALTTTQEYIGEYVYRNGALDYLIHEEGRVASEPNGLFYEYYLKDHLGNVRQVLRNSAANARLATMEQSNAEKEENLFFQLKPTRKKEPRHNITQGGQEVAWLNAGQGEMVGPGTTQEIFEGDSVTLSVHGKFLDKKKARINEASFATIGSKTALLDHLNELALNTSRAGGANPIAVLNLVDIVAKDLQKKETPEAYLIYALYDEDSNRYEVGKKVLTRNAANQHEELEEKLAIKKNGYIETFVVNETTQDVWFDNFKVLSQGSILVQETHYDPWGLELTGIGYEYAGVKKNKYLYQGKEFLEDLNLNIYDFHARSYDPVLGRTWQVDPMADRYYPWSPYAWVMNNPIKYMDPTGMFSTHTDENGNVVAVYNDGDLGVYRHQGKVMKSDIDAFHRADNPSANGEKMGETLVWWSFANPNDGDNSGGGLGMIDFGSNEARDWLNSTEPGGLIDYASNAGTGADQKYDYKSQGLSTDATPLEAANYQYRGSQIAPNVYASARDVGNIFAGMYGSLFGTAKHPVLKAMGAFNANQNKLDGGLVGQLFQNWMPPYGEDYRSHYMQNVGFDLGKNNFLFRKKFGVE